MKSHDSELPSAQLKYWHLNPEELMAKFRVDANQGLSDQEALQRYMIYGASTLKIQKHRGMLRLLFAQFNNPLIYLLLFCALLSLILYDKTDALIIFGIIIISGLLSFYQEKSALGAMEKLLKIVQIKTSVIRSGVEQEIPLEDVVPGDIIVLNAGNIIPGDCYLLESKDLYTDEATLTGETFYAEKAPGIIPEDSPIAKRTNTLFMGTHVISGTAKALVILTGKSTEFGKISQRLSFRPPETEFEHGIRHFGYLLMQVTFILLIAIFAYNIYLKRPLVESLLFALALAVGLTPQLLPAIITINLSRGAKRMAESRVIVKKLASIENFGSMNVLCMEKASLFCVSQMNRK